jgi:hypothetical protein
MITRLACECHSGSRHRLHMGALLDIVPVHQGPPRRREHDLIVQTAFRLRVPRTQHLSFPDPTPTTLRR